MLYFCAIGGFWLSLFQGDEFHIQSGPKDNYWCFCLKNKQQQQQQNIVYVSLAMEQIKNLAVILNW